jgi:cobalamin biosynthesis Mg chelatase CobN
MCDNIKKVKILIISILLVLVSSMCLGFVTAHDTGVPHSHGDEVTTEDTQTGGSGSSDNKKTSTNQNSGADKNTGTAKNTGENDKKSSSKSNSGQQSGSENQNTNSSLNQTNSSNETENNTNNTNESIIHSEDDEIPINTILIIVVIGIAIVGAIIVVFKSGLF